MVNVHDYAHSLARALKESPENQTFQQAKKRVEGKAAAKEMIADFHKKQIELQALSLEGKEPSEVQQEGLQRLYGIIAGDPDARAFLEAEQRLGMLLNDIYKIIGEAIDADFGVK